MWYKNVFEHQISKLEWILNDHVTVTLKTGVTTAENSGFF